METEIIFLLVCWVYFALAVLVVAIFYGAIVVIIALDAMLDGYSLDEAVELAIRRLT
mgnify:CR=1 FL=1